MKKIILACIVFILAGLAIFQMNSVAYADWCTVPDGKGSFMLQQGTCPNPTKQQLEANPAYYTTLTSDVKYTILSIGNYGEEAYICPAGRVLNPSSSNYAMILAYCGAGKRIPSSSAINSGGYKNITGEGYTYKCGQGSCGSIVPSDVSPDPRASQYVGIYTVSDDGVPVLCYSGKPRGQICSPDRDAEKITAVTNGITYVSGQGYTYTCSNGTCSKPVSGIVSQSGGSGSAIDASQGLSNAAKAKLNTWIIKNITSKSTTFTPAKYTKFIETTITRLNTIKSNTLASNKNKINTINYLVIELNKILSTIEDDSFLDSLFD